MICVVIVACSEGRDYCGYLIVMLDFMKMVVSFTLGIDPSHWSKDEFRLEEVRCDCVFEVQDHQIEPNYPSSLENPE